MLESSVVAVFRRHNGAVEVLIGTRRDDKTKLVLPGGKLDKGETPHEAAVRELKEETGIRAKSLTKLGRSQDSKRIVHRFYVEVEPDVRFWPNDDIGSLRWYKINEVPRLRRDHNVIVAESFRSLYPSSQFFLG
jgi:8-oxo-dGTP pyrophosphatase MutT (NUDIX family)